MYLSRGTEQVQPALSELSVSRNFPRPRGYISDMKPLRSAPKRWPRLCALAAVLLIAMPLAGEPVGPTPAPPAPAAKSKEARVRLGTLAESGLGKRDFKAQKRENQRAEMLH